MPQKAIHNNSQAANLQGQMAAKGGALQITLQATPTFPIMAMSTMDMALICLLNKTERQDRNSETAQLQ